MQDALYKWLLWVLIGLAVVFYISTSCKIYIPAHTEPTETTVLSEVTSEPTTEPTEEPTTEPTTPVETTEPTEEPTTEPPVIFNEYYDGEFYYAYYDVPLSVDLQTHIINECEKYKIDPAIVIAIIERESTFNPKVIGDEGRSFGLMQIQKRWHKERMERLGCYDLLDPFQNVTVGIDYLAELFDTGRSLNWVLMAYNGGYTHANAMVEQDRVTPYAIGVKLRAKELRGELNG